MLSLVALGLTAGLVVDATGACPRAQGVEERLAALMGEADAGRAARVRVVEDGGASRRLRVEIVAGDGAVLLLRELGGEGSCDERAEAAAVVVAAWLAQDATASPAATSPSPSPSPPISSSPSSSPSPSPPISSSPSSSVSSSSSSGRWEFAAAAGVVAGTAPALRVDTLWAPFRGRAMLRASLLLEGTRESALAGGQARWLRGAAGLGLGYRLSGGAVAADLTLDALLGAVRVSGAEFTTSQSSWGGDLGGAAGVQVMRARGRVRPLLGFSVLGWLGQHRAEVGGVTETRAIPRVDFLVMVGLGFGGGR